MRDIDQLKTPSAGRVLAIWRDCRETAEEPLERVLLANAAILAESCFLRGERVFADADAVLDALTGREMEDLLYRISGGSGVQQVNSNFDESRFRQLLEG
jgi:hypothetical protein